jgi:hypothetical protein
MYNINIYSYWKEPYTNNKKFSIYPLNDPGKKKYYSNQSHNYHYLKKTDPFVFKSITGIDYETLIKEQEDTINKLNKENKSFNSKLIKNNSQKIIFDENKNSFFNENIKNENLLNENFKNKNKFLSKSQSQENYITNKKLKPNNIYSEKIIENIPFNPKNPKTKHYFYAYRKPKNFFETFGYNISLKSDIEKYKNEINKLKYKTRLMSASSNNIKSNINNFEKPISNSFKLYNQKLSNSMEKYYQKGLSNDEIEKIENQKLNMNLLNQTSKKFRFKYKLPDLCKIAFHKKIIRNVNNGNRKELGENYNPYSLIHPNKNRTARNYIGDLFKH